MNKFNCPNCNKKMEYVGNIIYDSYNYDKWICDDCSHIIVLDWRSENE